MSVEPLSVESEYQMASSEPKSSRVKFSLTAAALTQLLAAMACFLGAFVLPNTFREFQGISEYVLIGLGTFMLALGVTNLFFGRQISRLMHRMGRRSRVVVPREGIGYLAIMLVLAVGALLGHRNMPLLVFGMMAGPFVFNGWVVYGMLRGVEVKRIAPHRAIAGQFASVEIVVHNTKRWIASQLIEVSDRITPIKQKGFKAEQEVNVSFVRIPGRSRRSGRYRLQFPRRGRFRLGPIRLSSRFPMGIGERGQVIADEVEVIVHPAIGRLLPEWHRQRKEMAEANQRVQSGMGLFDDEFHRIREYRSDDNPRAIHWRSTARQGELMVREFHQTRQANSVVLLDLAEVEGWERNSRELAISFAATLCLQQAKASSGSTMLLGISGKKNRWIASRNPAGFREEALDALALCRRDPNPDLAGLFQQINEEHASQDDQMIVITPRPEFASQAIEEMASMNRNVGVFSARRLTIVEATEERLGELFQLTPSTELSKSTSLAQAVPDQTGASEESEIQAAGSKAEVSA